MEGMDKLKVLLIVNHSIPLEERAKVYCCDHRMLRYISRVRWQERITNEEIRRCGVESLEHRFKENEVEMVWLCKMQG